MRPIMRRLARRYRHTGYVEDLEQAAALGLTKALERFDPEFGTDFLRYAVPTMIGEMRRWLRDHTWAVRPPREAAETWLELLFVADRAPERDPRPRADHLRPRRDTSTSPSSGVIAAQDARRGRWALSLDAPAHADAEDRTSAISSGPRTRGCAGPSTAHGSDELFDPARAARARRHAALLRPATCPSARSPAGMGMSQMKVCRVLRRGVERLRDADQGRLRLLEFGPSRPSESPLGPLLRVRRSPAKGAGPASRSAAGRPRRSTSPPPKASDTRLA